MRPTTVTLGELAAELARIGPHTAALAAQIERATYARAAAAPLRPRIRIAEALLKDLGPMRALMLLAAPFRHRRSLGHEQGR